jgi:hypothetical protein
VGAADFVNVVCGCEAGDAGFGDILHSLVSIVPVSMSEGKDLP